MPPPRFVQFGERCEVASGFSDMSRQQIEADTLPASFAQWVADQLDAHRDKRGPIQLFGSSVPEPVDLLQQAVMEIFAGQVSPRYASTFSSGNPYVVARLAHDCGVSEDHVLCTTGATGALSAIYRSTLGPGERVLIENPGFDMFRSIAGSIGNEVDVFERRGPTFSIDPEELEYRLSPRTRLIVLSNLHNPSGMAVDEDILREIDRIAANRGITLVVDEVYAPYAGGKVRSVAQLGLSRHTIAVSSLTKIFGLSTLRCGWLVADPETLRPIREWNREVEFGVSKLAHAVASCVLDNPVPFEQRTFGLVAKTRPVVSSRFERWKDEGLIEGALPDFGCIAFWKLPGIEDTAAFSQWLASECGVAVVPGEYFGAPGFIRIGFGIDVSELERGLDLLESGIRDYRRRLARGDAA